MAGEEDFLGAPCRVPAAQEVSPPQPKAEPVAPLSGLMGLLSQITGGDHVSRSEFNELNGGAPDNSCGSDVHASR